MPSLSAMAAEAKRRPNTVVLKKPNKNGATKILSKSTEFLNQSDMESETESEEESDSDEEPAVTAKSQPIPAKHNAIIAKAASSSSSSGSEEDSEEVEEDEEESEEDSSEEESESEEEKIIPEKPLAATHQLPQKSVTPAPPPSTAAAISSIKYSPPSGFEALSTKADGQIAASSIFKPSNLAGKEVWYITAPASIPISQIKKVSMRDVQSGKSAISLNGQDYGFVQDKLDETSYTGILVPDDVEGDYRLGKKSVKQTLHLQHIVKLPSEGPQNLNPHATVPAKKPIRQQPGGLKMRFLPIGFGDGETGNLGSSDEDEIMDDAAVFRPPNGPGKIKKPKSKKAAAPSSSKEKSLPSDEEMADALPVRVKKVASNTSKSLKRKQTA